MDYNQNRYHCFSITTILAVIQDQSHNGKTKKILGYEREEDSRQQRGSLVFSQRVHHICVICTGSMAAERIQLHSQLLGKIATNNSESQIKGSTMYFTFFFVHKR